MQRPRLYHPSSVKAEIQLLLDSVGKESHLVYLDKSLALQHKISWKAGITVSFFYLFFKQKML